MDKKKFEFPPIYMELDRLKYLDTSMFINRDSCEKQKYLWLYDMEWLTCKKILNYKYQDDESRDIVPFAITGNGDKWAWYLNREGNLPVIFCPSNDEFGKIYAENIEAAMFRQILEFVSQANFYKNKVCSWKMNELQAKKHLNNWKLKLNKYFKEEWITEIDNFIKSNLKYYIDNNNNGYYVFITKEEADKKIEEYLNFPLINKTVKVTI